MNVDTVQWLTAFAPIFALLLSLLYLRWSGDEAALLSLVVSLITAEVVFGGGLDLLALSIAKGMWTSISIIFVIFPALLIYEVSREAGAFSAIRWGMQNFTPDKTLQIIAIGWVFVDFLQGITGFGVPVVVCAPLLISMGVKPLSAVIITLFGQMWGNTFGTLGIAWEGLVGQVSSLSPILFRTALLWTSNLLILANVATGFAIVYVAGGITAIRRNVILILCLSVFQGIGQSLFALMSPTLCNFVIAAISMGIIFFVGKLPYYQNSKGQKTNSQKQSAMSLTEAFLPYALLVVIAVGVLLSPLKDTLSQWKFALAFMQKVTTLGFVVKGSNTYAPLVPLVHSGTFLLLGAGVGYFWYARHAYIHTGGLSRIIRNAIQKTIPSAIAVVGLISMSKIMDETGQTVVLAQGVVLATGNLYPLLAPFIGLLGTFMTASNLSSNILFGGFQEQVASMLGISKAQLLAAQTAGGAVGSVLSPSKILLGTTAANIMGKEGEVLKGVMPLALAICAIFGLMVYLSYWIGG